MQAMILHQADGYEPFNGSVDHRQGTASIAFAMADDMLAERRLREPKLDYKAKYEELSRKVAHGCTDALCGECDAK